ncbi:DUF389 domain-containing protein [Stomatohabitans albus]|uniref:DUF389 domain-containing protein n=1 Tax=Stomatohabitans albus TaxID=3110766 RepID=UPI00300DAA7E
MPEQRPTPRTVRYWTEHGTIRVGAIEDTDTSAGASKARRAQLKKAAKEAESSRLVSILIPVGSLEQIEDLVSFSRNLLHEGQNGRIVLARIRTGDEDKAAEQEVTAQMEALAETMRSKVDSTLKVDSHVRKAPSRSRGILDAAIDETCSMIVMHDVTPGEEIEDGKSRIGALAREVISAAEVPVLICREGLQHEGEFNPKRVVVATDLDAGAARMVDLGSRLANGLDIPLVLRHVIRPGGRRTQFSAQEDLKALIGQATLDRGLKPVTSVVKGPSPESGISHEATRSDLTILGIRPESAMSVTGYQTTASLYSQLRGPVIVMSVPDRQGGVRGFFSRRGRTFRPRLTSSEAAEMRWQIRLDATSGVDYLWMSVLSAAVAVFGLITDSVPVLIGAMLVAPLMGPLIATGAALVSGDLDTLRRGTLTTLQGILLVVITSYLITLLIGPTAPTDEMIKRGSPTLLDCGIGVVGGIVGAYALARPGVIAASAGVAIAAALVPPLCVAAMTFNHFPQLSLGAFVLFFANVLAIVAASGATLLFLGMEPERDALPKWIRRYGKATNAWLVVPVLGLAIIAVTTFSLVSRSTSTTFLTNEIDALMPNHSVSIQPSGSSVTPQLIVRIIGEDRPTQDELDEAVQAIRARTSIAVRFIYEPVVRTLPQASER